MAYSSITINFLTVPNFEEILNITETSLGLNLNALFQDGRTVAGTVKIPPFQEYDGMHPARYFGYISSNYKYAFNLDYNGANLFTVIAELGEENSGLGSVTISANYPDAVFVVASSTINADIVVTNEIFAPPPPGVILFTPASLLFKHEQNTPFESAAVTMSGDLWSVVGKPNFLLSSATAGVTVTETINPDGNYQTVSGSGNAIVSITLTDFYNTDAAFLPSDLAGVFAVLNDNVAYGEITYTVEVTRLADFLTIPYAADAKAFTLDPKFFEFHSDNIDTYFQFDATIKTYEFFTNIEKLYLIPLKIVLFQGFQKENLGQVIHRLMHKFTAVNDTLLQYQEAILKITCSEISFNDETVVRSGTSADIPFLAGLTRGTTTVGFLDFNPNPNRVTKNSFAYLNILIPDGIYELRTFKNGVLVTAEALPASTGVVLCKKVLFSNYDKGDVIQFMIDVVDETNALAPTKTYILFPDDNYSNMIVWENEFLLQSAIECTGSAAIDPEGEFQSQIVYVDLVERLEHLSTSKVVKLFINTGWLLYSDIDTVESLMRCKRAWLIQGNTTIALRPTRKNLPKKDLEEELIQFPLEFQINQNYNEETYSL